MFTRRIKSLVQVALCLFWAMPAFAECLGTLSSPCIVQDTNSSNTDLKHFRDMYDIAHAYPGNIHGLEQEWVSGSGVPRAVEFMQLSGIIAHLTDGAATHIIDIDLRQESHGYLNGEAITLAEKHDWINRGKSNATALADEANWLHELRTQATIPNVLPAKNFKEGQLSAGNSVVVTSVQSEEEAANAARLDYVRLMVTDHLGPNDFTADQFVALVDAQDNHTWFHIHCRGGDGRTTTFLAMYDMLKNANRVSFADILHRQAAVSPFYDLFQMQHSDPELTRYYKARLLFLQQFYRYSQARLHGYRGPWSKWKAAHPFKMD